MAELRLRDRVRDEDVSAVREIVRSTGVFRDDEILVAEELVREHLARGPASGYFFVFADDTRGTPVGYACFGPIACTAASFDLYWIAVGEPWRRQGLGRRLLTEAERRIAAGVPDAVGRRHLRGRRVYIETSARPAYEPARRLYERCGYVVVARLTDFYAPGDDKVIYVKDLTTTATTQDVAGETAALPGAAVGGPHNAQASTAQCAQC